jgi:osomolarity two-component system sensor histidine kinase SLN1
MSFFFYSNACKFTPSGGKLTIKTRLILPALPPYSDPLKVVEDDYMNGSLDFGDKPRPLSKDFLTQHDIEHGKPGAPMDWIVVRIEVSDTGYGIKRSDMARSKLFSAFNQTEQGRQQGASFVLQTELFHCIEYILQVVKGLVLV